MRQNLARWDRLIRLAAFAVLFPLGVLVVTGVVDWFAWLGAALVAVSLIMIGHRRDGILPDRACHGHRGRRPRRPAFRPRPRSWHANVTATRIVAGERSRLLLRVLEAAAPGRNLSRHIVTRA